jgi:hypothetical protein
MPTFRQHELSLECRGPFLDDGLRERWPARAGLSTAGSSTLAGRALASVLPWRGRQRELLQVDDRDRPAVCSAAWSNGEAAAF